MSTPSTSAPLGPSPSIMAADQAGFTAAANGVKGSDLRDKRGGALHFSELKGGSQEQEQNQHDELPVGGRRRRQNSKKKSQHKKKHGGSKKHQNKSKKRQNKNKRQRGGK